MSTLSAVTAEFSKYRSLAEAALEQISPADYFAQFGSESNSIALVMKHVGGNLASRWQDVLRSDGEKPGRERDQEFELLPEDSVRSVRAQWDLGFSVLFGALGQLRDEQLGQTITIRGQPLSLLEGLTRSACHTAYHVGQIVYLAKCAAGSGFRSLSIPRRRPGAS
jgi:hypothetical protein